MKKLSFLALLSIFSLAGASLIHSPLSVQAAGPVSASNSTVTVSSSSVEANYQNNGFVTVYVRDTGNVAMAGKKVQLSTDMAGVSFSPDAIFTDGSGYAQFSVKSSRVGNAIITATVDGVILNQKPQINFYYTGAAVSPSQSSVTVSKTIALANGTDALTFKVTTKDSSGNLLTGKGVTFFWTTSQASGTSTLSAFTNSQGEAGITFNKTSPMTITLHAEVGGVVLNTVNAQFSSSTVVSTSYSSLTATPNNVVANGLNNVYVTATVKDAQGNPLSGKNVAFTTVFNGQTTTVYYITNSAGKVDYYIQPLVVGTAAISATVDGIMIGQTTVQYLPSNSNDTTVSPTQSTAQLLVPNGTQSFSLTVYARNALGQPLGGRPVQVYSNIGFTSSPSTVNTNIDGNASFVIKPTSNGNMIFTVRIDGVELNQKPSIQVGSYTVPVTCPLYGSRVKLVDDKNPNTQEDSAVYYIGNDCRRHAFSNARVYYSWFSDFNGVQQITATQMASVPLGKNITYRPGAKMIKFPSVPKVYMVSKGGVLRWVPTEWVASQYFGADWKNKIEDVSEAFYTNYTFGADIFNIWDYNVGNEYTNANLND